MQTSEMFMTPDWPAPTNVRAYTSLRNSNISNSVIDLTQSIDGRINRTLLKNLLQLPADPIWIKQIHTDIALKATASNLHCEADASFADEPNQVCAILTADCLPVLVCDKQGKHVAAIHAGWRGLAKGVIEKTIQSLPVNPEELLVWLGPAIGPEKFIVRQDVYDAFTAQDSNAETGFKKINDDQWLANLYTLARLRLDKTGITAIFGGDLCTHSDQERFFSYRRQGKMLGYIVSVIWLAE